MVFCNVYDFVCCVVYFAFYLTGLSSTMLIWAAGARCKWKSNLHNRISWQRFFVQSLYHWAIPTLNHSCWTFRFVNKNFWCYVLVVSDKQILNFFTGPSEKLPTITRPQAAEMAYLRQTSADTCTPPFNYNSSHANPNDNESMLTVYSEQQNAAQHASTSNPLPVVQNRISNYGNSRSRTLSDANENSPLVGHCDSTLDSNYSVSDLQSSYTVNTEQQEGGTWTGASSRPPRVLLTIDTWLYITVVLMAVHSNVNESCKCSRHIEL